MKYKVQVFGFNGEPLGWVTDSEFILSNTDQKEFHTYKNARREADRLKSTYGYTTKVIPAKWPLLNPTEERI